MFEELFEWSERPYSLQNESYERSTMKEQNRHLFDTARSVETMETGHLVNTVNLLLQKLEVAKSILDGPPPSLFDAMMNIKEQELLRDDAERFLRYFKESFPFYILELLVRNVALEDQMELYRTLLGRDGQINLTTLSLEAVSQDTF